MDERATTWAHLPRDVAFDRGITHGAARLLACLHTLAIEQNPQSPVTDPMTPDELRSLVRLFGRSQFYKHMKDLNRYALIEIEKLPGNVWRVRPLRVFLAQFRPENRTVRKTGHRTTLLKDSKSVDSLKALSPSPENRTEVDPKVLEALRSVGVGGKMRSLIALSPHTTPEYVESYVTAIEAETMDLRLAIVKMRDGDPLQICEECHRLDGQHTDNCDVSRQNYLKGWFDDD